MSSCSWPALFFARSEEGKGWINKFRCQAFFSHIYWGSQLSLAPCYCSTLFSWKRTAPLSSDQAHFLLHRPRNLFWSHSDQEPSGLLVDLPARLVDLPARLGGSAFLVAENLLYLSYRVLQRYLTICKYYVSLWCTFCSCLFLNQKCLFGRRWTYLVY